jgi:isoquinoline 1-oxidoreductase beta subunit
VKRLDRREFLRVGATAAGGLFVALRLPAEQSGPAGAGPAPAAIGAFVEIERNGSITIAAPRPEIGQGVLTSIPMLLAEELDVDWTRVRVRRIEEIDPKYLDQFAGGSTAIHDSFEPVRKVGAAARAVLVAAAAARWGVDASACRTESGAVLHPPSGRRLGYEDVAADASVRKRPESVTLKTPDQFRIVGRPVSRTDTPEIVTGRIRYGLDQRLPGMLYAVIARSPVVGGAVEGFDAGDAGKVRGVRRIFALPADPAGKTSGRPLVTANGVAVVAESSYSAMKARGALRVKWNPRGHGQLSTDGLREECAGKARRPPDEVVRNDGDVDATLASAARSMEAEYDVPFVEASPLEPMNCTALWKDGRCELWAPTQNPYGARAFAASVLGVDPSAVVVHMTRPGGGFGRRLESDYVAEAAIIAREMDGSPVQLFWTREDEIRSSPYRSMGHHHLRAGIDRGGNIVAWTHQLANPSRYVYQHSTDNSPRTSEIYPDDFPAGTIPNFRVGYTAVDTAIPRGYFRSMVPGATNFVLQSFLDEIAAATRTDPLELRRRLLGASRELPYRDHGGPRWSTGRLRRVLDRAAEAAGWGKPLPKGRGRGLACGFIFGSYAAEVAEVEVGGDGRVRVHRVVAAVDPGLVVNPRGVEAQVEGAVMDGLNLALNLGITIRDGRVEQGNFDDYPFARIGDAPRIEVAVESTDNPPWGMGEIAVPCAVSSIANAIFSATGRRLRRLPIRSADLAGSRT